MSRQNSQGIPEPTENLINDKSLEGPKARLTSTKDLQDVGNNEPFQQSEQIEHAQNYEARVSNLESQLYQQAQLAFSETHQDEAFEFKKTQTRKITHKESVKRCDSESLQEDVNSQELHSSLQDSLFGDLDPKDHDKLLESAVVEKHPVRKRAVQKSKNLEESVVLVGGSDSGGQSERADLLQSQLINNFSQNSKERDPFLLESHTNQLQVPEQDDGIITNSKIMTSKFFQLKESHHSAAISQRQSEAEDRNKQQHEQKQDIPVRDNDLNDSVIQIPGFERPNLTKQSVIQINGFQPINLIHHKSEDPQIDKVPEKQKDKISEQIRTENHNNQPEQVARHNTVKIIYRNKARRKELQREPKKKPEQQKKLPQKKSDRPKKDFIRQRILEKSRLESVRKAEEAMNSMVEFLRGPDRLQMSRDISRRSSEWHHEPIITPTFKKTNKAKTDRLQYEFSRLRMGLSSQQTKRRSQSLDIFRKKESISVGLSKDHIKIKRSKPMNVFQLSGHDHANWRISLGR